MTYASLDDPQRLNHPVWVVYNTQRTACLNAKYYGQKKRELERETRLIDLVISLSAPGSAFASLAFLKTDIGKSLMIGLSSLATILVLLKAVLKSSARLKELEKRVNGYQAMMFDLKEIADKIATERKYSTAAQKLYAAAQRRYSAIYKMPPDKPQIKLIQKLMIEVEREMPAANFYIPEE